VTSGDSRGAYMSSASCTPEIASVSPVLPNLVEVVSV